MKRSILGILTVISLGINGQVVNTKDIEGVVIQSKKINYTNKKENPAYAVLKKVWDKNYKNAFNSYENYKYEEYQKIEASFNNIDSAFSKKKLFKGMEFMFKEVDSTKGKKDVPIYINESITDVYVRNNKVPHEKRIGIAQKASGFEDNQILIQTVQNLYKDFNIYENVLNFFDKGYTSPLSKDGFSVYEYELVEDATVEGELCYQIKYRPKNNAALAFRGVMYISKEAYAVKNITLNSVKNSDVNFVRGINADLTYYIINENSFIPVKSDITLDLSLANKKKTAKGIYVRRELSYKKFDYNKAEIEAELDKKPDKKPLLVDKKDEAYWVEHRHEELSDKDQETYANIEKLWQVPRFKTYVKVAETIGSGYINAWKAVDFGNLYSIYGSNGVEGSRLRLGARTFFSRNDLWRVQGYAAYGFRDKKFKFGGDVRYMINPNNRLTIGYGFRHDILQLGVQLMDSYGVMERTFASSSFASRGENNNLSWVTENTAQFSIEPMKNFQIRWDGSYREIKSAAPEFFKINYVKNGIEKSQINDANMAVSLIYRPKAKYSQYGLDRYEQFSLAPTYSLKYTKGFSGIINSDFDYDKIQFSYKGHLLIGPYGRSDVNLELGKTFGSVPLSLMSVVPGNQSYGLVANTFSQLNYYEFVADAYSSLIFEHHFNGWIFNKLPLIKKLKFREVAFLRGVWGSLEKKNIDMNRSSMVYSAPKEHVYYEYGFGIENIGLGNFRIFRLDFNWRGNYLDRPDAQKFGMKFGMQWGF